MYRFLTTGTIEEKVRAHNMHSLFSLCLRMHCAWETMQVAAVPHAINYTNKDLKLHRAAQWMYCAPIIKAA